MEEENARLQEEVNAQLEREVQEEVAGDDGKQERAALETTVAELMAEKEGLAKEAKAADRKVTQAKQVLQKKLDAATAEAEKAKTGLQSVANERDTARQALLKQGQEHKSELAKQVADGEARDAKLMESTA